MTSDLQESIAAPPALIPVEPGVGFADLGLRPEIMRAIEEAGYTTPTPIQARAIPEVLARRDVVGIAQTGTGKTASFVLPMLHVLAAGRARARMPRSLILSPTRELATQTARNFELYGKHLQLSMALLIGGVGMGDQEKLLDKGVDVLIATPGRLLDWFERGKVMLNGVDILVIDEADRMFDMGFMPDVERLVTALIGRKQTLLFSATMVPEVRRLAERFLKNPAEIKVDRQATTSVLIDDVVVDVSSDGKRSQLVDLIRGQGVGKAIVFCNRKRDISAVMRHLQKSGLNARDLHGDLDQSQRQATLDNFTAGTVDFLVATDVAARGLDISDMPVVINFDVPYNPEDYVHRIGRTGRAGRKGRAFTLVTAEERKTLAAIEKLTKRPIRKLGVAAADEAEPAVVLPVSVPVVVPVTVAPPAALAPLGVTGSVVVAAAAPQEEDGDTAPVAAKRPAGRRRRPLAGTDRQAPRPPAREEPVEPVREARPMRDAARDHVPPRRREPEPYRRPEAEAPRRREVEPDAPIVGLGDHVPSFLLRPVPAKLLARSRASAAEP